MKYPVVRCAVLATLLSAAVPAQAADPYSYFYLGLGMGYSHVDFYPADFSTGLTDIPKDYDAGFRVFAGYQINRNWAFEIGYNQAGKFSYDTQVPATNVNQQIDYKVTGMEVSLLPTVPFGSKFSIFGRLGGYFSQARTTIRNPGGIPSDFIPNIQASTVSFLSGLGLQYIGDQAGMRLEYENLGKVGSTCSPFADCSGRANVQQLSINVLFKF
jgi:OmpA-OmpF porin, OOP family